MTALDETKAGSTHRRLLIGYLTSVAAMMAVAFAVMLVTDAFSTTEFALFLFGAGALVGCLGLSHSHALKCANIRLDPASRPGRELWIVPPVVVAGLATLLYFRADSIPDTRLATASVAAAVVGVTWAVVRGCTVIHRIGSKNR